MADEALQFQVYTDPALKVRETQLDLIRTLRERGLICFRVNRIAILGPFTVDKKGTSLRLVFDCRMSNLFCRCPPKTFLSTPSALSRIRLNAASLAEGGAAEPERPYEGQVVAIDLVDSFYLFHY